MNTLLAIGYRAFIVIVVIWWMFVVVITFVLVPDSGSQAFFIVFPTLLAALTASTRISAWAPMQKLSTAILFIYAPLAGTLVEVAHESALGGWVPPFSIMYVYAVIVFGPCLILWMIAGVLTFIVVGPQRMETITSQMRAANERSAIGGPAILGGILLTAIFTTISLLCLSNGDSIVAGVLFGAVALVCVGITVAALRKKY